jgi:predicted dehydrogenase
MLNVGVVGLGRQNVLEQIPAIIKCNETNLVAVCNNSQEPIDRFNQENPSSGIKSYLSFEEMTEKESLNFVVVAVPNNQYTPIIEKCGEKGIHVLKEKPFARNLEEALLFNEISAKKDIHIMTAFQRRFHPLYCRFADYLENIGEITHIQTQYTLSSKQPNSGWRGNKNSAGGGVVLDMGCHIFDLLIWYFGRPEYVKASMSKCRDNYDVEDTAHIAFRIGNIPGIMYLSCVHPVKSEEMIVIGTKGTATLNRQKIERKNEKLETIEVMESPKDWDEAMIKQIEHFSRIVKGEIPAGCCTPDFQTDNHVITLDACYLSHEKNERIYLGDLKR